MHWFLVGRHDIGFILFSILRRRLPHNDHHHFGGEVCDDGNTVNGDGGPSIYTTI